MLRWWALGRWAAASTAFVDRAGHCCDMRIGPHVLACVAHSRNERVVAARPRRDTRRNAHGTRRSHQHILHRAAHAVHPLPTTHSHLTVTSPLAASPPSTRPPSALPLRYSALCQQPRTFARATHPLKQSRFSMSPTFLPRTLPMWFSTTDLPSSTCTSAFSAAARTTSPHTSATSSTHHKDTPRLHRSVVAVIPISSIVFICPSAVARWT